MVPNVVWPIVKLSNISGWFDIALSTTLHLIIKLFTGLPIGVFVEFNYIAVNEFPYVQALKPTIDPKLLFNIWILGAVATGGNPTHPLPNDQPA